MKKLIMTLSLKNKNIIPGLVIAAIFILFSSMLFLTYSLSIQKDLFISQQKLLVWLHHADQRLQHLPASQEKLTKGTLPATLQSCLAELDFTSHITQFRQNEKGAVQLSLNKVNFNTLMTLLNTLNQRFGATVSHIRITRASPIGEVNVSLLLED